VVSDLTNQNYAAKVMDCLVPRLLLGLNKRSEIDYDEWDVSKASAACLTIFAQTCTDRIVPCVVSYVEASISHSQWQIADSAAIAFGSILDGPRDVLTYITRVRGLLSIHHDKMYIF
jgi:importin subunit beta-1